MSDQVTPREPRGRAGQPQRNELGLVLLTAAVVFHQHPASGGSVVNDLESS